MYTSSNVHFSSGDQFLIYVSNVLVKYLMSNQIIYTVLSYASFLLSYGKKSENVLSYPQYLSDNKCII